MKVLGIDPGLASCGWALLEENKNRNYTLIAYGEIATKKFDENNLLSSISQRLSNIFLELQQIIKKYNPDVICVEKQFYSKISKNMINTYFATGIVYLLSGLMKINIKEFSAKTVKLAVSGYGSASKLQLKEMLKMLVDNMEIIKSSHINDAIAIALCYLNANNEGKY
ncbi:MAG: crossover junction endodeoxyribonuclease RuvC [Endomicrobia bacterium]|nr:crossover junction endodeoxyribonuclease RuvC [Endomicrobiia bacterium]